MTTEKEDRAFSRAVVADMALHTGLHCGSTVAAWTSFGDWAGGKALDGSAVGTQLEEIAARVRGGDLRDLEVMLVCQAVALQSVFNRLAQNSSRQNGKQFEATLALSLKAQGACRATILALSELKTPRQATFVRQQNVSGGAQQVNNAASLPAPTVSVTLENTKPLELTNATASNLLVPVIPTKRVKALAPARPREEKTIAAKQSICGGASHGRAQLDK